MATAGVPIADPTVKTWNVNDYADLLQTPYSDAFAFSDDEQHALDLYDKLRELELEKSFIAAFNDGIVGITFQNFVDLTCF